MDFFTTNPKPHGQSGAGYGVRYGLNLVHDAIIPAGPAGIGPRIRVIELGQASGLLTWHFSHSESE